MNSYSKYLAVPVSAVAIAIAAYMFWRKRQRKEYHAVGEVVELFIYPVKSCRRIPLDSALCTEQGFKHDRRWIIVNEKGRFISAREKPTLAVVAPTLTTSDNGELECLQLDAPNMDTLKVPLPLTSAESISINVFGTSGLGQFAGEEAAEWFSKYLNKPGCKLYYMTKPRHIAEDEIWGDIAKPTDKHGFADFSPLMVSTTEALDALNKELDSPVKMRRFRPNIVIKGTNTFEEDNWKLVKINDVVIRTLKNCDRCTMTIVDPDLGTKTGKEPLATLKRTRIIEDRDKRFGDAPWFGIQMGVDAEGTIKIGDTAFAKE